MLRPVHRSHVLGVVVVIAALGRTERVAEPELVTPVMTPEQFAPVDDTDVIRGALSAEATVQLPESGAPFGATMLWTHGQIDTTTIPEITADIALDKRESEPIARERIGHTTARIGAGACVRCRVR